MATLTALTVGVAWAGDDKRERGERRLQGLETRIRKLPRADGDEIRAFLQSETQRLIARTRGLSYTSYEFDRMMEALDDLLDACEDLAAAVRARNGAEREKETRDSVAKQLERAYFRVQQGDYFARLSADSHGREYVLRSRQLYQRARAAYDTRDYRRAAKLASASSELVNVLENLAQAAVRKPEPPVLE
jgi:hypothetical protein